MSAHPTSEAIAAYLSEALPAPEREQFEAHLAECRLCRHEVTSARRLLAGQRSRPRWAWTIPAAAAVLALIFIRPGLDAPVNRDLLRSAESTRAAEGPSTIEALLPPDGSSVPPGAVRFVWRSAGPDLLYRLTLTDGSGKAIWSAETPDTSLVPGAAVHLEPGRTFFWVVDALGPDGRSRTTRNQRFTTVP